MVSIHGYNPERKPMGFSDIYIKATIFGLVLACITIVGGMGVRFLVELVIEYWAWALGAIMLIIIVKKLFLDRRKQQAFV